MTAHRSTRARRRLHYSHWWTVVVAAVLLAIQVVAVFVMPQMWPFLGAAVVSTGWVVMVAVVAENQMRLEHLRLAAIERAYGTARRERDLLADHYGPLADAARAGDAAEVQEAIAAMELGVLRLNALGVHLSRLRQF